MALKVKEGVMMEESGIVEQPLVQNLLKRYESMLCAFLPHPKSAFPLTPLHHQATS